MNTMTLYTVQLKASAVLQQTSKLKLDEAFALAKAINDRAFELDKMEDCAWYEKQLKKLNGNDFLEIFSEECEF